MELSSPTSYCIIKSQLKDYLSRRILIKCIARSYLDITSYLTTGPLTTVYIEINSKAIQGRNVSNPRKKRDHFNITQEARSGGSNGIKCCFLL